MRDVLTKTLGTSNPHNVVRATLQALRRCAIPRSGSRSSDGRGMTKKKLSVTQVKSEIGYDRRQRDAPRSRHPPAAPPVSLEDTRTFAACCAPCATS